MEKNIQRQSEVAGNEVMEKRKFSHSLRVSLLGGAIDNQNPALLEGYKELGKMLSQEGVVLSAGPILENTYIDVVTTEFTKEEVERKQKRKNNTSPKLIEFIPARRTVWVDQAKEKAGGSKTVKEVEGGVPLLTAVLERPQTGLFIFCPPSLTSSGTLSEALQAIAHVEVVIKTNQTAKNDETKAKAYPMQPKIVFIGWPERDKQMIEEIIQRSKILTPTDDPQRFEGVVIFMDAKDVSQQVPPILKEQSVQFDNWFRDHRTTLSNDF